MRARAFARHGLIGLALIAVFWPLNWLLPGLRTHLLFFPLWLGYILTVDALVLRRRGSSLLTRSPREFVLLFLISAPGWWLFEIINWRTQNWHYIGRDHFSDLEYFLLASLSFSTVVPAVFESAELIRSFTWIERLRDRWRIPLNRKTLVGFFAGGVVLLGLVILWPHIFYPFVWASLYCMLDPINAALGRPSILARVSTGDWRPAGSLAIGALTCGFFWEMWNYFAYPKWMYQTPGVEFLYVFEMPLLGYLGYLPFSLELYALVHLVRKRAPELAL